VKLRRCFFEPRDGWFSRGLLIESATPENTRVALARLPEVFRGVEWDLLSLHERPGFRQVYQVKRRFGGVRLLWPARRHYDLVALFHVRGDSALRLCKWLALAVMRPARFFVFIERGEGLWLGPENAAAWRSYFKSRRGSDWLPATLARLAEFVTAGPRRWFGLLWRALRWTGLLVYASATLALAVLMLAFFRLFYDTKVYRFRVFGKKQEMHPQRALGSQAPAREP
jgi:hypothetical protein